MSNSEMEKFAEAAIAALGLEKESNQNTEPNLRPRRKMAQPTKKKVKTPLKSPCDIIKKSRVPKLPLHKNALRFSLCEACLEELRNNQQRFKVSNEKAIVTFNLCKSCVATNICAIRKNYKLLIA